MHAWMDDRPLKVIVLGDAACGKTKLLERFLLDKYFSNQELSTHAVNIYDYTLTLDNNEIQQLKPSNSAAAVVRSQWPVQIWDTAGQEIFDPLHPSYYFQCDACILIFDVTRKITYKNLYDALSLVCLVLSVVSVGIPSCECSVRA